MARLQCSSCNVDMEEHNLVIPQISGQGYHSMKCPKCGKMMLHDNVVSMINEDIHEEKEVDWAEHDRIMKKFIEIDMGIDPYDERFNGGPPGKGFWAFHQLISHYIRDATKFQAKTDKFCPRCNRNTGLWVETEAKTGKIMGCKECDFKWFYEFP